MVKMIGECGCKLMGWRQHGPVETDSAPLLISLCLGWDMGQDKGGIGMTSYLNVKNIYINRMSDFSCWCAANKVVFSSHDFSIVLQVHVLLVPHTDQQQSS